MIPMTIDQQARCAVLAKRIAELDPNWAKPGMACRSDGTTWRYIGACYYKTFLWAHVEPDGEAHMIEQVTQDAPRDIGPDYADDATLGCLLMVYLPDHELLRYGAGWCCHHRKLDALEHATRAEAIFAAVVAKLETKEAKCKT